MISVSIVSHNHGKMVEDLVKQVLKCHNVSQLIITRNLPEALALPLDDRILCIDNERPKGFGANHNAAFTHAQHPWFVVLNPDVVLNGDPFSPLLAAAQVTGAALVAPQALGPTGASEDNWRRFPTFMSLLRKALGGADGRYDFDHAVDSPFAAEWVSGLCIFVSRDAYKAIGGFDEKYFMYYEDVDLCVRAWQSGFTVFACPSVRLVHNAQRASRREFRHMRWHAASMLRYFVKHAGRLPKALPKASK